MASKFLERLSGNYIKLLESEEDFNVIIEVGISSNSKEFRAHSIVLKYRSTYFCNELENATKKTNNITKISLKPHISIKQFEIIIKYIYGGVVSLENLDESLIFELMLVASELLLDELVRYLENDLIKFKDHWLSLHFAKIYKLSFQNNKLLELQKWCTNTVAKYPNHIFDSDDFTSLQENALVSLIKRDDLQAEEIKIWNRVIKWGITQNPDLSPVLENWTRKDFITLKTTLKNCLPHIRYFQIPGDDIMKYVLPYKDILETNLWEDLIRKFMAPNQQISSIILPPRISLEQKLPSRSTDTFSKIITKEHAAEIVSWIDRKEIQYNSTNNPYEFKLLLRGSKDGFTNATFWNLCDRKANTIVIMKVKGTYEILGGYNPIEWNQSTYGLKRCEESFIFSLKNGNIPNSILSRIKYPEQAIYCSSNYGPLFGNGTDLGMTSHYSPGQQYFSWIKSYEKPIRSSNSYFSVDEFEVFQIKRIID